MRWDLGLELRVGVVVGWGWWWSLLGWKQEGGMKCASSSSPPQRTLSSRVSGEQGQDGIPVFHHQWGVSMAMGQAD